MLNYLSFIYEIDNNTTEKQVDNFVKDIFGDYESEKLTFEEAGMLCGLARKMHSMVNE